jgi:hypothetical protein
MNIFSKSKSKSMSQLLQQDSNNSQPVRRPVGRHETGVADDPRPYNVVPTMMRLPPVGMDVDVFNGHPQLRRPHMQELAADPNQPGMDRMIADFGPVESYHERESYPERAHRTNVPLTQLPNMPGTFYVRPTRPVNELSSLRAQANSFIQTAGVRKPIYGI